MFSSPTGFSRGGTSRRDCEEHSIRSEGTRRNRLDQFPPRSNFTILGKSPQGQHYQEADLASNTLSTQTFQTALIGNGAWQFFHAIWEHRNGILHDANININIEKMDNRIRQLHRSPSDFVRPSSLCLFEAFSLEDCINLHPSIKHALFRTIFLAIKAKHGDLKCLDADNAQTIITNFFIEILNLYLLSQDGPTKVTTHKVKPTLVRHTAWSLFIAVPPKRGFPAI